MFTAHVKFTSDFLVEAFARYRPQHWARHLRRAVKLIASVLLVPLIILVFWAGQMGIGLFLATAIVFLFYAHHVDYWLMRRAFRKSPYRDQDTTIEVSDAGFHSHSAKADVTLQWSAFTKVVCLHDGFLLFQGPRVFHWIPLSSLSDPSGATGLDTLLRSKVPAPRDVD